MYGSAVLTSFFWTLMAMATRPIINIHSSGEVLHNLANFILPSASPLSSWKCPGIKSTSYWSLMPVQCFLPRSFPLAYTTFRPFHHYTIDKLEIKHILAITLPSSWSMMWGLWNPSKSMMMGLWFPTSGKSSVGIPNWSVSFILWASRK